MKTLIFLAIFGSGGSTHTAQDTTIKAHIHVSPKVGRVVPMTKADSALARKLFKTNKIK